MITLYRKTIERRGHAVAVLQAIGEADTAFVADPGGRTCASMRIELVRYHLIAEISSFSDRFLNRRNRHD